jgi:hypothetical protein
MLGAVIAGVGLATFGDYNSTLFGFLLTIFGTFLAALKTVATNLLQTSPRLKLHPLDLLNRMSGLAFCQCVIYALLTGELARVREYGATQMDRSKMLGLIGNGIIAFFLNIVSFSANKKTSALTMTVAANVKQVLTILFAVYLFDVRWAFPLLTTLTRAAAYRHAHQFSWYQFDLPGISMVRPDRAGRQSESGPKATLDAIASVSRAQKCGSLAPFSCIAASFLDLPAPLTGKADVINFGWFLFAN